MVTMMETDEDVSELNFMRRAMPQMQAEHALKNVANVAMLLQAREGGEAHWPALPHMWSRWPLYLCPITTMLHDFGPEMQIGVVNTAAALSALAILGCRTHLGVSLLRRLTLPRLLGLTMRCCSTGQCLPLLCVV